MASNRPSVDFTNFVGHSVPFNFVRLTIISLLLTLKSIHCSFVVKLSESNFDSTINKTEVVFVNFYADWCRFSNMLEPIFEEAAAKFHDNEKVVFGSVDCDKESTISQRYQISKYPTLKLFHGGKLAKREYRQSRTADAMYEFIKDQVKDTIKRSANEDELFNIIDLKKRNVIAYLMDENSSEWSDYKSVASNLKDDCQFYVIFNTPGQNANRIVYKPPKDEGSELLYTGTLDKSSTFHDWVTNNCIPLVREITFENAEELTEEGLPFLILFKEPNDEASLKSFTEVVQQLQDQKNSINFLYADGIKFAHPLHHLGKTKSDLPLIAIDSFRHMYLFPDFANLNVPGKLRQFVDDMHSGKLHREFHHGPDPVDTTEIPTVPPLDNMQQDGGAPAEGQPPAAPHEHPTKEQMAQQLFGQQQQMDQKTSPPLSVFQKLRPSNKRYSLKEEL